MFNVTDVVFVKMKMMNAKIDKQKNYIISSLKRKFQKEVEANKNEIEEIKEQMKGMKTNLEEIQNLVRGNVGLNEKVKEEAWKTE